MSRRRGESGDDRPPAVRDVDRADIGVGRPHHDAEAASTRQREEFLAVYLAKSRVAGRTDARVHYRVVSCEELGGPLPVEQRYLNGRRTLAPQTVRFHVAARKSSHLMSSRNQGR